jgi:hypothetical protein
MQTVDIMSESSPCSTCGSNLSELGNFIYLGITKNFPREKDEQCKCTKCGTEFTLHYDYFDDERHINSFVFNGDINDPTYNWQDQLTPEQINEIAEHLTSCNICSDRLNEEMASDAWLASLLHNHSRTDMH